MDNKDNTLIIKNAVIVRRNFEGRVDNYNKSGDRTFSVVIDNELAIALKNDGWNVKFDKRYDADDPDAPAYLDVKVSYDNARYIPKIVQVTYDSEGRPRRTFFHKNTVANLDSADIEDVRLEINPHNYTVNNHSGIKAYLRTMYFTLVKDPFEDEYGPFADEMQQGGYDIPFSTEDE